MDYEIVLLAYKFSPYKGIGSYRWSKLCKYLAKKGIKTHVFTSKWCGEISKELQNENIIIHKIPSFYPNRLHYELRFSNKYLEFFRKALIKILNYFIFYNGESTHWEYFVKKEFSGLISAKNNIRIVIATGAPFHTNAIAALLKLKFPEIKIIQDFRDPWSHNKNNLKNLFFRTKILKLEEFTIQNSDLIVATSDMMLKEFLLNFPTKNGIVINNGFDPDSYTSSNDKIENNQNYSNFITLIHAGSITNGREVPLYKLLNDINTYKGARKYKIILVGFVPLKIQNFISSNWPNIIKDGFLEIIGTISQDKCFDLIRRCDFALLLSSFDLKSCLSTKVYEYAKLQIPTLCLNYGGAIEDFFIKHKIGFSVNLSSVNFPLLEFEHYLHVDELKFDFNIEEYSHENLAAKYLDAIRSI